LFPTVPEQSVPMNTKTLLILDEATGRVVQRCTSRG
jgi:hypothetical protein